jgi:hypothetical protein
MSTDLDNISDLETDQTQKDHPHADPHSTTCTNCIMHKFIRNITGKWHSLCNNAVCDGISRARLATIIYLGLKDLALATAEHRELVYLLRLP